MSRKKLFADSLTFSLEQLYAMGAAIQGKTVAKEDFKITSRREYGASHARFALAKELGLDKVIYSRLEE